MLALYKLYIQFPQGLRLSFDALKRRLSDENISVTSCAVNVICELARKKPKVRVFSRPSLLLVPVSPSLSLAPSLCSFKAVCVVRVCV